jgi:transposase-like protein
MSMAHQPLASIIARLLGIPAEQGCDFGFIRFTMLAGLEASIQSPEPADSAQLNHALAGANKILSPHPAGGGCNGYSNDLRVRVIQVVEGGNAARAAARQFVIGASTAIRWAKRWRETGSYEAKSNKGQSRSPLKKHEDWLLDVVQLQPDLSWKRSSAVSLMSVTRRRG